MVQVALLPASHASAVQQRYQNTIWRKVCFNDHEDRLTKEVLHELRRIFPDGQASMWGITPGSNGANIPKVTKLRVDDFVLFYGKGEFYLAGTVALTWHSSDLARHLWGYTKDRQGAELTWEYMFALKNVRTIGVPLVEVQRILGWKPNALVQGFNIFTGEAARRLGDLCNPASGNEVQLGRDEMPSQTRPFDGPTDGAHQDLFRREQQALRRRLEEIGGGQCALCGRALTSEWLRAAHIKRRSQCTEDERRDFDNVGMLACSLGCDNAFEYGFVTVDNTGTLEISSKISDASEAEALIRPRLEGRKTSWWTPEREKYFDWHRTHIFLRMLEAEQFDQPDL
jgi:hypothetical protein